MAVNYKNVELYSQEDERVALTVLLKDSNFIVNLDKWDLKPETFYYKEHRALYSAIISLYNEKGSVDPYLVANKLKTIGITKYNDVNIFEYLTECLMPIPISKESYPNYFENLCRWYFLRQADTRFEDGRRKLRDNRDKPLVELQGMVEKISTEATTISVSNHDDEFVDFYGTAEEVIKNIADKGEPMGIYGPWKTFNDHYGPFTFGDLFIFAARSKVGKSTVLAFLADYFVHNNLKVKVLYFDSELESYRVQTRGLAAATGVNEFYYRHGGFKEHKDMVSKAESVFDKWKNLKGRFYHIYAGNKTIDDVESIVKRFHSKHIKDDEILLCVYDYIKHTGEDLSENPEWFVIGEKTDRLKKLASSLSRTVMLSAIQLNQEDNVAQSGRVSWTCSYIGRLRRKGPEDLEAHTDQFGTHYLETLYTRSLGEFADETVTYKMGNEIKYLPNNINLKFDNFSIEDMGSFKQMIKKLESQGGQLILAKDKPDNRKKKDYSKF